EVGQVAEAKVQFEISLQILERLAETESETPEEVHVARIARGYRNIGRAVLALEGPQAALTPHQKALELRETLLTIHSDKLFAKQEIAETLGDLGRCYLDLGQPARAADLLVRDAEYRDEWLAASAENEQAQMEQVGLRRQIGLVRLGIGDTKGAIENLRIAVDRLSLLTERGTANSRDLLNLGLFRSGLGDALLMDGNTSGAVEEYQKAATAIDGVLQKNPGYVPAMRFLAGALYGQATAEKRLNDPAAEEHLQRCIELRRAMVAAASTNPEYERSLMQALARAGQIDEALKIAETQKKQFAEDPGILYQIACAYSLASLVSDTDAHATEAVHLLTLAVEHGYEGTALMGMDPDLEPLATRDDFQQLLKGVAGNVAVNAAESL
ncbi:MAG: hypothetical protein KDA96_04890, partial [Planctomycetaceae bacterium]|nr:hypothetical protein [Planctomycetaceae bacterium]